MTINLSLPQKESEIKPRITVIGVGGAGGNAVLLSQRGQEGTDPDIR